MRIQGINTYSLKANSIRKNQKLNSDEPQNSPAFRGIKGGAKGGAIGALAALGLAAVAGPVGIALLPLWTVGGAIAGDALDDDSKGDKNNKK